MDGMGMMGMMIWGIFSFLLGLLLIVLLIVAGVAVVRWLRGQRFPLTATDRDNAMDILKKRYASGEISKEEFQQMKRDVE